MNRFRNAMLEYITNNMGEMYENDSKIICVVDESALKSKDQLVLNGFNEKQSKLIKKFNLNKQFYYVIDGYNIDKPLFIFGYNNANIVIKNCSFNKSINISNEGDISFENVIINYNSVCVLEGNNINIDSALICANINEKNSQISLGSNDSIMINNSIIGRRNENSSIWIVSKNKIDINGSYINGSELTINSNMLSVDDESKINANKKLQLEK